MHENLIPKFLIQNPYGIEIWDLDTNNTTEFVLRQKYEVDYIVYSIQGHRIYWLKRHKQNLVDLMTLEINENNSTKMASYDKDVHNNNLNKSEKFNVLTCERYYEIQNLTPFTEYKLKFTLSNFYFNQLSINPFHSNNVTKTILGKLNAPENVSVLALTPTIAVVYWMPLKKVNCMAVTYEMHWESDILMNGTQQKSMYRKVQQTADFSQRLTCRYHYKII
ncbi:hypothetical protein EAG_10834 [Camponotus floridanus]|uniref:Proto-oncogene tyrosine-protein kinase ROS n=1 Tax=Camponotus floridanus TaxID=104421 RepID=E2A1W6_CAMFO|nr:hypothetical protein EAG_10834 [Camponotus floridanus]